MHFPWHFITSQKIICTACLFFHAKIYTAPHAGSCFWHTAFWNTEQKPPRAERVQEMYDSIKLTGITCKTLLVLRSPNSYPLSAEAIKAVKLGFLSFVSPCFSTKKEKADWKSLILPETILTCMFQQQACCHEHSLYKFVIPGPLPPSTIYMQK